tara:strand:- start:1045 stop:1290 length:246 start_codon:yes stop_codon:yes gene_type:complete
MKTVRNISMQGLSIPFGTPKGTKNVFLAPSQQVEVPDEWRSKVAESLVHRRMVKLINNPNPEPVAVPTPPVKKVYKSKKVN